MTANVYFWYVNRIHIDKHIYIKLKCLFIFNKWVNRFKSDQSNSFKRDFHWPMYLFIVLRNWFDVWIPSIFSTYLLKSLSSNWNVLWWSSTINTCSTFIKTLGVSLITISSNWSSSWWSNSIFPLSWRSSQERYSIFLHLAWNILLINFILIRNITVKNERSCIKWCLESTLSWFHCWAIFWSILDTHCLNSLSSYRLFRSILSKEFRICHSWVIECNMVVHGPIKILSISSMSFIIIFRAFNVEIWNPP